MASSDFPMRSFFLPLQPGVGSGHLTVNVKSHRDPFGPILIIGLIAPSVANAWQPWQIRAISKVNAWSLCVNLVRCLASVLAVIGKNILAKHFNKNELSS